MSRGAEVVVVAVHGNRVVVRLLGVRGLDAVEVIAACAWCCAAMGLWLSGRQAFEL